MVGTLSNEVSNDLERITFPYLASLSSKYFVGTGLYMQANTKQCKLIPATIRSAPFQLYMSMRNLVNGGNTRSPNPVPDAVIPVAKDMWR